MKASVKIAVVFACLNLVGVSALGEDELHEAVNEKVVKESKSDLSQGHGGNHARNLSRRNSSSRGFNHKMAQNSHAKSHQQSAHNRSKPKKRL